MKFKDAKRTNFVVGDEVKVIYMNSTYKGSVAWAYMGDKGRVVEIRDGNDNHGWHSNWPIRVNIGGYELGFREDELTSCSKPGQQLLFSFMSATDST